MSAPHEKLEALFNEALSFTPGERLAFLAGACGNDAALRRQLEELLRAEAEAGGFLPESPKEAATIRVEPQEFEEAALGSRISHYKLLQKVGEGGCGVVYMAEQEEPVRRRVALKVIKLGMDTRSVVARFEAERQALAMMDHPNIAKVLDAGTTEQGRPYFVMELVRGIKITDYCDQNHLNTEARLVLFIKVCQAVQHAHQKGIIHRDLKPSNILVTLHDGVPVPKVIDFGIAKAIEQKLTENTLFTALHQFLGTPAYMSPEQAEMSGLDIDTRSDIYSLGVLLYELLTGQTPFDGHALLARGIEELLLTLRDKQPPRPSTRLSTLAHADLDTVARARRTGSQQLRSRLRGDLDCIVMKCLEKDRTRRYETANGLAADLRRHLANEPVVARPPSRLYEFQRTVRRHKVGFAAAAAVLLALAIGLGFSVWQGTLATRARDQLRVQVQATDNARREAEQSAHAEAQQRTRAETLLRESQTAEAELTFAKGLEIAERGDADYGMMWMIEALKRAPAGQTNFADMVRRNLSGLSQLVPRLLQAWESLTQAFSADGAVLAVQLSDGLHLLDARSGAALTPPIRWPDQTVVAMAFHPRKLHVAVALRRENVAALDAPAAITVVDARTGRLVFPLARYEPGAAQLLFSRDGAELFVIGGSGRHIAAWDAATGKPRKVVEDRTATLSAVALSPDGRQLVPDDSSAVLDASSLETLSDKSPEADIAWHFFRPDGAELLTHRPPQEDLELRLPGRYDTPHPRIKLGQRQGVAWFSADGNVITSHERPFIELATMRRLWSPFRGNWGGLVTDPSINILATRSGRWQSPRPLSRPAASVRQTNPEEAGLGLHRSGSEPVQFTAAGDTFLHRDDAFNLRPVTAARLREARTGFPLARPLRQRGSAMYDVALSRDGRLAATTTFTRLDDWHLFSGETMIWNATTGERLQGPLTPNLMIRALEFSPDGKLLVASTSGRIHFWNTQTGRPVGPDVITGPNIAVTLVFSPDGKTLAAGLDGGPDAGGHVRLYNLSTRQPLGDSFPAGTAKDWCMYLAITPDGQTLLSGAWTTGISVTDLPSRQPRYAPIKTADAVSAVALSADGSRFAIAVRNGLFRVFDLLTGQPIGRAMQHSVASQALALNANGTLLVSGSVEGTVRLWDVATSQPLGSPLAHRFAVWDVRFASDGRSFSSTDRRGITKHWPVPEPARGEPAALQTLLETWVGTQLTNGVPTPLSQEEWRQHKSIVDGFPPGSVWFPDPIPEPAWHESRATDAEGDGNWYTAWWHLERLVTARPNDWQLRARRGRVQVLRGELAAAEVDFAKAAELEGRKALLDWFAHCAYACREDQAWKSALYFLDRLVVAEPEEWQWRADQEEAFEKLGRTAEAQSAFVKALELCRQPIMPTLAAELTQAGNWAALHKELSRAEKTGWLSLEDWRLWARCAKELGDQPALVAIVSRFKERAGPDCPLANALALFNGSAPAQP